VEFGAVVKALAGEEDEIINGVGRVLGVKLADDLALGGVERGGLFLVGVDRRLRGLRILLTGHGLVLLVVGV
jgi:hypothetical protein